jgi:plastocyanin
VAFAFATDWTISCGYHYEANEKWGMFGCYPNDLSVVVGDTLTFVQNRSVGMYVFSPDKVAFILDKTLKESLQVNPMCAFPVPTPDATGTVEISSTNGFYASGPLDDESASLAFYASMSGGSLPFVGKTWKLQFTAIGVYSWWSCVDDWNSGTITVVPETEAANIPSFVSVSTDINAHFDAFPGRIQQLQDLYHLGNAYTEAPSFTNEEGFTTWEIMVSFADPDTQLVFYGFSPPNITITQGDTIRYKSMWYKGPEDDPYMFPNGHTVYFNASVGDANWQAKYIWAPSISVPFGPAFNYFPWFKYASFIGLFESPEGAQFYGNPKHYSDGLLSSGYQFAVRPESSLNYFNVTFASPGTFPYVCYFHLILGMVGEIEVSPREISDRSDSQIEASLSKLDVNLFVAAAQLQLGPYFVDKNISLSVVSATHGIFVSKLDKKTGSISKRFKESELPLVYTTVEDDTYITYTHTLEIDFSITIGCYGTPKVYPEGTADLVGAALADFYALETYTPRARWSFVWNNSSKSTYVLEENTTYFPIKYFVLHNSASGSQVSFLFLAISIFYFLFH